MPPQPFSRPLTGLPQQRLSLANACSIGLNSRVYGRSFRTRHPAASMDASGRRRAIRSPCQRNASVRPPVAHLLKREGETNRGKRCPVCRRGERVAVRVGLRVTGRDVLTPIRTEDSPSLRGTPAVLPVAARSHSLCRAATTGLCAGPRWRCSRPGDSLGRFRATPDESDQ